MKVKQIILVATAVSVLIIGAILFQWARWLRPYPVTEMSVTRFDRSEWDQGGLSLLSSDPNWETVIVRDTPHGPERVAIMFMDGTNRVLVPKGFNLELHGSFLVNGVSYTTRNNRVERVQ